MEKNKSTGKLKQEKSRKEEEAKDILFCPWCEAIELTMDDLNHRAVRCLRCGRSWIADEE